MANVELDYSGSYINDSNEPIQMQIFVLTIGEKVLSFQKFLSSTFEVFSVTSRLEMTLGKNSHSQQQAWAGTDTLSIYQEA